MSLKLIPLTEAPFGSVIVTVIVVVAAPPTGTVEGLNDFEIVRGNPLGKKGRCKRHHDEDQEYEAPE